MINAAHLEWIKAGLTEEADRLVFKDGAGDTIVEFAVPSDVINAFIANNAVADVSVHLDGTVHVEIIEGDGFGISKIAPRITIDDLVARDTAPDMLADEPDAVRQLDAFEARLKRSLALVQTARNLIAPNNQG